MKKNIHKKQGFSLIELIVVIAVIAAIATVIVPTIGNFSDSAKTQAEKRNVQLWNSTYMQAKAANSAFTKSSDNGTLPAFEMIANIGGTNVVFRADEVTVNSSKLSGNAKTGYTYNP